MKFTHVIEGASFEEFKNGVAQLYSALHPNVTTVGGSVSLEVEVPVEKKTRKSKKEATPSEVETEVEEKSVISAAKLKEEVAQAPEENPFGEDEASAPEITFADVNEALKAVNAATDLDTVRAILSDFGVAKVTAVKKADYPKFIAACKKATA